MSNTSGDDEVAARWDRERWANFSNNLTQVLQSNPFQQKHISAPKSANEWNCFEDFIRDFPFTEKQDLARDRQEHPPYGTNLTFPVSEYKKFNQTSGTQGKPMAWLDTMDDWNWMLGNWDRVLEAAGGIRVLVASLPFPSVHFLVLDGIRSCYPKGLCMHTCRRVRALSSGLMVS